MVLTNGDKETAGGERSILGGGAICHFWTWMLALLLIIELNMYFICFFLCVCLC